MTTVSHQAMVNGYHNCVWFSENTITNIIVLSNLSLQYLVAYMSDEKIFIVNRESVQFIMHESGLHYFDPKDQEFTSVNTVSKNNGGFTYRPIKDAEAARDLYAKLIYPSDKDYTRWFAATISRTVQ